MSFPKVRPIKTPEELRSLALAAEADDHTVLGPTHVTTKDGEIVGYIGTVPFTTFWAHSEKCSPRDSLYLLELLEVLHASQGIKRVLSHCSEHSDFYPQMERLGYKHLPTHLFYKEL